MLDRKTRTSEAFCQFQIQLLKLFLKSLTTLSLVGPLAHEALPKDFTFPIRNQPSLDLRGISTWPLVILAYLFTH